MSKVIAVPSEAPGGMDAGLSAHFGHCDLYTLVRVEDGKVADVNILPNVPHEHGGCMAPVQHLAKNGANQLVAGGMGMRPLTGFNEVGIEVYFGNGAPTVGAAIQAMLDGQLRQFVQENTCQGGCNGH